MEIQDVCAKLESLAPLRLAESWDSVGLLVGDAKAAVSRVMTCLTITPESCEEAIAGEVELIVTHHPLPFRPVKRLTTDHTVGRLLWQLARQGIAVYSPHTAWDSASRGINSLLAEGLRLTDVQPLLPSQDDPDGLGSGRFGICPPGQMLADVCEQVKRFLRIERLQYVGQPDQPIRQLGIACGSAGSFLEPAHRAGCDALLTGEASFHVFLEAESLGMGMVLPGHFASERFSLDALAAQLVTAFPELTVWSSRHETDPLRWC